MKEALSERRNGRKGSGGQVCYEWVLECRPNLSGYFVNKVSSF